MSLWRFLCICGGLCVFVEDFNKFVEFLCLFMVILCVVKIFSLFWEVLSLSVKSI